MKILTVVGARPQFIKAAPTSRAIRAAGYQEYLVHTGQHYDQAMSGIFFDELGIPAPDLNLEVGSGAHGLQTAQMLIGIEEAIEQQSPDWVLLYGDTNSTLAGALAAAKLRTRIAHVEAGLRSFNRMMPEETNRVLTDHCSDLLLCPTKTAVDNLRSEGIVRGVHLTGDVMADALSMAVERAADRVNVLDEMGLQPREYILATVHRAENTDHPELLQDILEAFNCLTEPIVFPVHPRTRKAIELLDFSPRPHLRFIDPVSYLKMVQLEQQARLVLTDSGGIQKEAYWLGVPCVTMRNETEWVETVEHGWNKLVGTHRDQILDVVRSFVRPARHPILYGDGNAAERCVALLTNI